MVGDSGTELTPAPGKAVQVSDDLLFSLSGKEMEYRFHVNDGELVHDHFGGPASLLPATLASGEESGWGVALLDEDREFPDSGRGDYRLPAIHIRHTAGHTVSDFQYVSHEVVSGKQALPGLPSTFGAAGDVTTLVITMVDAEARLEAQLRYSVFPRFNAIARSFTITNNGPGAVEIQRAASFPLGLPNGDWDMIQLSGDWAREANQSRRPIHVGLQGFQSSTGYSSHYFNPFVALASSEATENRGEVYGLSLIWSGSFAVDVERFANQRVRAMIGMNALHLQWPLAPGESFTSPECVGVYSSTGIGGMSRALHGLFRQHLSRSPWTLKPRPTLLNSWEGMYFDFDAEKVYRRAKEVAQLGVKLFVMDDGWFGDKHKRMDDHSGLGDWVVNPDRFPDGLNAFVKRVNNLQVKALGGKPQALQFGIWVEPEMVNPNSELYEAHPDWVLHAGKRKRTERRQQLVLDLSRREVQDYIIKSIGDVLSSANVAYVKWDNNRGMHEMSSPATAHGYMLGLYRVMDSLTTRFPEILWEGCASGGGRFDPGMLYYWPQSWTSDDTDALERLHIQFGTTLAYPASSMGCHISACPNHQVARVTPLEFRAHVALMGGSFGFELDLSELTEEERATLQDIIVLAEKVNPLVITGEQYRLALPDTNWPAVQYMSGDGDSGVLLAYQIEARLRVSAPPIRLEGLDAKATYEVDGVQYSGAALSNAGLRFDWHSTKPRDYQSQVLFINKV